MSIERDVQLLKKCDNIRQITFYNICCKCILIVNNNFKIKHWKWVHRRQQKIKVLKMQVQKWDAFALKKYMLKVNSTNNHFTLATILLSIAIVALSLCLNLNTLSHLWLPKEELPIAVAETLAYPDALTTTRICYKSNNPNNSLPSARVFNTALQQINLPFVSAEQIVKENPQLNQQIGPLFGCLDMSGMVFSQNNRIFYVQVMDDATLYIQTRSIQQIISQKPSKFLQLRHSLGISIRMLHAQVRDTLSLNSQAQIINTFHFQQHIPMTGPSFFPFPTIYSQFALKYYVPQTQAVLNSLMFNVIQLTITRMDIGTIVGSVLSWVSILGLICGLIVGPLMQKYSTLIQIQSLFHIEQRFANPSLIKFVISSIKTGIFAKEDHYVKISQRMKQIKDVQYSMKICKTLKSISIPTPALVQTEILANQQCFGINNNNKDLGYHLYKQKQSDANIFDPATDKLQESSIVSIRKGVLKWLDIGSDEVSLKYSGHGYGSKLSLCLTILVVAGFFAFLIIFNIVAFDTKTQIAKIVDAQGHSFSFNQNQIVIVTTETTPLSVYILDGDMRFLQNVTLINGQQCLENLTSDQKDKAVTVGTHFYCFSGGLTLTTSQLSSKKTYLYINNMGLSHSYTMFHFSPDKTNENLKIIDPQANIGPIMDPNSLFLSTLEVSITKKASEGEQQGSYANFNPVIQKNNRLNGLLGLIVSLKQQVRVIDSSTTSLFDVVQSVWGFGTVCFTVLLLKLTKYINVQQKQQKMTPYLAQHRQNLGITLSKVSQILRGINKPQLSRARYYMKQKYEG